MPEMFDHSNLTREVLAFRCPRWDELPAIELYMDQLTGYINEIYAPLANPAAAGDFTLTKAMVNNYVKMRVIERPVNKKYSRVQLARLVTLCAMKQVLSLPELSALSEIGLARYPMPKAYNYFCVELENALRTAFSPAAGHRRCPQRHHPAGAPVYPGLCQQNLCAEARPV